MNWFDILIGLAPVIAWALFWNWLIDFVWGRYGVFIIWMALELELLP